ncbi:SDR family NAD(P)-dependent oxidoreductase [Rhodococcus sp. 14-2470-1a]|uniref:SDR family NAD(P)-dependent oxidoreductase n=1 Tax=Rhodococcus sp. 14-2470-1a TaxID=2023150 RepID=UPI000B9A3D70|nr:SDR family NAD(P)-dependent oxidoreductase [Rhodococcus sp. 14-2470-1a]OZF42038.1 hypothetical protein CH292_26420 [Rhodococcus sp. 14-2470-1a]
MQARNKKSLITAGTGGIGLETALGLARAGHAVTVVGRDGGRGEAAVARLESEVPGAEVRFVQADMSSIKEVSALGASITAEGPLDVLVNNVGGMYVDRLETADGIERSLMLNHIAPMILTDALIGVLTRAAPSRIVNITSAAISASSMDFADIDDAGPYYGMAVTGRAKAMHLVHTNDLAEKLKVNGISVIAVDPGGAATSNAAEMKVEMLPPSFRPYWDVISAGVQGSAADAAQSVVFAATDPSLDGRTGVEVGSDCTVGMALASQIDSDSTAAARRLTERLRALWVDAADH